MIRTCFHCKQQWSSLDTDWYTLSISGQMSNSIYLGHHCCKWWQDWLTSCPFQLGPDMKQWLADQNHVRKMQDVNHPEPEDLILFPINPNRCTIDQYTQHPFTIKRIN